MSITAVRARRLVTMAGEAPAVGKELLRPLRVVDNGLLVSAQGRVIYAGGYAPEHVPTGVQPQDLGDVVLVPAAINAHTHIQLAHLAGKTLWGQGFTPWLRSLIPWLAQPLEPQTILQAVADMVRSGTAHVADYTSHGAAMVGKATVQAGLGCTLLAEWFGFAAAEGPWPPRCVPVLHSIPDVLLSAMAPAGHALYSTSQEILQSAHQWCRAHTRPFAMHLAESPEETQALTSGDGPLVELYAGVVFPPEWSPPGMRPVPLAARWGLLGPETLAVHGVQCDAGDAALLQGTGTHLCLCPRSNEILAVGTPPIELFVKQNVRLCLGTDGLTSNTDMNVWNDAVHLLQKGMLPAQALLRLCTVNGAAALSRGDVGALTPGRSCHWAILPPEMVECWQ